MEAIVVRLARESFRDHSTFAVRVHRVDKRFSLFRPSEMERWLGQVVRERSAWERVRLDEPDVTLHVDIYADAALFYSDRPKGVGGLPVASSGHALSLLSGGIDSPVGVVLCSRGAAVPSIFVHMSATHMSGGGARKHGSREARARRSAGSRCARASSSFPIRISIWRSAGRNTGYETVLFRRDSCSGSRKRSPEE